jgi:hypothetical protein
MKIWSSEHVFNHSWDNVIKAALQKYPNPLNPNVIGVDVVDRKVEDGLIKSHRLMASKWAVSPWIANLLGGNRTVYASEHSQIDGKAKTLTMHTRNISCNSIISIDEKLEYSVHPEDSSKTLLQQEAVITVKNVPLTDYLENKLETTINSNADKGRQAIEFVIHKLNNINDDVKNVKIKLPVTVAE